MAFHIPFEHRNQGTPGSPIYIGFDAPVSHSVRQRQSQGWNWWAFFGFPMSLFALVFTFGLLSPVALLLNLIGLRKRPRKLATAGTLVSLIGTSILVFFVVGGVASQMHDHHAQQRAMARIEIQKATAATRVVLSDATAELVEFVEDNEGFLPSDIDACILMLKHEDAWGEPLRYDELQKGGVVRSAGPDCIFDNDDDLTETVEGKTFRQVLLPVN